MYEIKTDRLAKNIYIYTHTHTHTHTNIIGNYTIPLSVINKNALTENQ